MNPADFRKLLSDRGLDFVSSHIGRDVPDSTNWDETMAWWDTAIAAHKAAGVRYIVQPWMGKVGYGSLDGLQRYCAYFDSVGAKCKDAGIRFGYHNHNKEFETLEGETIYDYMLTHTNPENVFFQLDVYWATVGGASPAAYLQKYPGRFDLWHIKDDKEIGASGKIDFASIYNCSDVAGMKYAVIEQEDFSLPHFKSIRQSRDYLQNATYVKPTYSVNQ